MCSNSPNIIVPFSCLSYNLRHSIKSSNDPKSFDFFTSAAKKKKLPHDHHSRCLVHQSHCVMLA